MKLGNGERNYFWSSNWSPFGRIRNYLRSEPSSFLGIASNSTLSELWERDHWVLPAARSENQVRIFFHLTSLTISDHQDQFDWCPNDLPSEKYFTKLIYNLIREPTAVVTCHKEVWFSGGIPKHKFLTWLMTLNRCPTKDTMLQWGLQTDGSCILCRSYNESRDHLFFECPCSSEVWFNLALRCSLSSICESTLLSLKYFSRSRQWRKLVLLCWQATIYSAWTKRNHRIHRNNFRSPASLLDEIDKTIRLRIASYRFSNSAESSDLLQLWFAFA
ncbi:hypothetical protein Bca52824_032950 [Brassica carinata]|uniref:Reverse transcriptase zinc-binding domain-containing protein n=1 Tax=Brassica carinata TaxID=52824 RepID=A0A8X7SHW0_BRACI|nr:hypothetical protein Bca52824_032950 [Brassica carinata]